MNKLRLALLLSALVVLLPAAAIGGKLPYSGAVYVMANAPEGNEIIVYDRDATGGLTLQGSYPTGGLGTGGGIDPLASQGSLILSSNKRWLVAVNAGSNNISVFHAGRKGLALTGIFDSGGVFPVSVALDRDLLYVLNAGQGGSGAAIAGYKLNHNGDVESIPESTRQLEGGGFHQVAFTPRGDALVVTQGNGGGPNAILVFGIDEDGVPDDTPTVSPSSGIVPFGFIFDWRGHLLVSEAGSGAVSSYAIDDDLTLSVINASVANGNSATCWIIGTWRGDVITANTASDNLSLYGVNPVDGTIRLLDSAAGFGDKPIDMATTKNGRFLYVLNAGNGSVGAFKITHDGLEDLGAVAGLPLQFAQGIAVR